MAERHLRKVLLVLDEFRRIDAELPTQTAATFIVIALESGSITVTDVSNRLGYTMAAASRNVDVLSDRVRKGKPGYGLVEVQEDAVDRRRKILSLTREGNRLTNKIEQIMSS